MNRYALFEFESYYPTGGGYDFTASSDNLDDLKAKAYPYCDNMHAHIFDRQTDKVILGLSDEGWYSLEE